MDAECSAALMNQEKCKLRVISQKREGSAYVPRTYILRNYRVHQLLNSADRFLAKGFSPALLCDRTLGLGQPAAQPARPS